jgi:hypothetical protein
MATMINPTSAELRPAANPSATMAASPARPAWRRALALVTGAYDRAIALYRRWDGDQERCMDLAADNGNVHLLFPHV